MITGCLFPAFVRFERNGGGSHRTTSRRPATAARCRPIDPRRRASRYRTRAAVATFSHSSPADLVGRDRLLHDKASPAPLLLRHNGDPHKRAPLTRHHPTAAMQAPAATAAAARFPHRGYVACLSGGLAALLAHAAGAELCGDELLGELKEAGLITYLPPQLARWLEGPIGQHFVWLLGAELFGLLWWLLVLEQGPSSPHRPRARLSGTLAEELAGPNSPSKKCTFQLN